MSNEVDRYDVEAMIHNAGYEIKGDIRREIEDAKTVLRSEIAELQNEVESLRRVLESRTEQLA